ENAVAGFSAQQVVDGRVESLAFDIPEGDIDGGNRGHGDGAATPIGSAIEVLPDVFRLEGIATDEARDNVLGEVTRDGQFAAVEGPVAESVNALVGFDLQRDKIAARRSDVDASASNLHRFSALPRIRE